MDIFNRMPPEAQKAVNDFLESELDAMAEAMPIRIKCSNGTDLSNVAFGRIVAGGEIEITLDLAGLLDFVADDGWEETAVDLSRAEYYIPRHAMGGVR